MKLKVICFFALIFTAGLGAQSYESYIGKSVLGARELGEEIELPLTVASIVSEGSSGIYSPSVYVYRKGYDYLIFLVKKMEGGLKVVYDYEYIELSKHFSVGVTSNTILIHNYSLEGLRLWYLYDSRDLRKITDYIVEEVDPISLGIDPSSLSGL